MLTINCEEGRGSDGRVSSSWTHLALVLGLITLCGVYNLVSQVNINDILFLLSIMQCVMSQKISPYLKIESTVSIIAKDEIAIKAGQVSVKT